MNRNTYTTLIFCIIINTAFSQFIPEHTPKLVPNNLHGQLDYNALSLFDSDRFDIQQGFSISMMNVGNQSVSVAGYSNNITYWANNNLRLNANILLYQPVINALGNQNNGPKIALDAGLIYQPTKNTFLQINFKNLPNYGSSNNLYGRRMPNNNGLGVY
ncbi:MAG: hypothetical protein CBD77_00375 [bacterium TMED217]|nr:MAG: hypothetical protein CBD77_00375 [bacterium TMED217]|tara:strand:- start:2017 stop:2493 length:477 start_codon:yes stop_codon:yes gene_type:complete